MKIIYLVHFNYDYEEALHVFTDLTDSLKEIQDAFGIDAEIGDPEFESEVNERYDDGKWKGFTFHALDPATSKLTSLDLGAASKASQSNHARLAFEKPLFGPSTS